MRQSATGFALLLLALACQAAEAPAEGITWQEANRRSAALIREKGPSAEAADLARAAFDLYPQQTKSYSAENHAQLLLNLADARRKASDAEAALAELDRGAEAVVRYAGARHPVLIEIWKEAAVAAKHDPRAERYAQQALELAESLWGPDDRRSIALFLDHTLYRRGADGTVRTLQKYRLARERAIKLGEDSALVAKIDLVLAKAEIEERRYHSAIEKYLALVDRLDSRTDHDQDPLLEVALAQLEYAYERAGRKDAAADVRRRRLERMTGASRALEPLVRVTPTYPASGLTGPREGFVDMLVSVGPDGSVTNIEILTSRPRGYFDHSAVSAVKLWKFKPKVVDGEPVETSGVQRIEYKLAPH